MGGPNLIVPAYGRAPLSLALGQENFDGRATIEIQSDKLAGQMTAEQGRQMNEEIRRRLNRLDDLLNSASRFEIEVEGVVFDDGTFVGTNSLRFFELMNAATEGLYSVINELDSALKADEEMTQVIARLKEKFKPVDLHEMLKPYGDLMSATKDPKFQYDLTRNTTAHWIGQMREDKVMNYVENAAQRWHRLTKK